MESSERSEREGRDHEAVSLDALGLDVGKRARLRRVLFDHGAGNGTALFLPYDQGARAQPA